MKTTNLPSIPSFGAAVAGHTRSLSSVVAFLGLLFAGSPTVNGQFSVVGPPPVSTAVARQQIRTLLEKVDPANRQQTITTLLGLSKWYRDLLDQELIAAWQKDDRAKLAGVMEPLAGSAVSSAVVEFSWRQRRQATFSPALEPTLENLMYRFPDSARPFLDDLLAFTATGQPTLDLSQPEAEAVCRILLDMPDIRDWKKSALQILPHFRGDTEALLDRDLRGNDKSKSDAAQVWLVEFKRAGVTLNVAQAVPAAAPRPDAQNGSSNSARPPTARGMTLSPLDPATIDDASHSINGNTAALIDFVNRSGKPVDIYWIDYSGKRVLYRSGLAVGATWSISTALTHPWLVVASGTGGSTARDTGTRLAAFEAATPNSTRDPAIRDTAIITNLDGTTSVSANTTPPGGPGAMGPDGVYRPGNGVTAPSLLVHPEPEYSEVARKLGISGVVLLSIVVGEDGTARDFRVIKSLGYGLDEKAIEAVRKWRFKPGMKDGKAVAVQAQINETFRLGGALVRDYWYYSGPMDFALGAGATPPVVKDVTMPRPVGDSSNERVVLGFTVDSSGSVKNIHSIDGSKSASDLLSRNLAKWKFQPAMNSNGPVEATGTVSFVKGPDEIAKLSPGGEQPAPPRAASATAAGQPAAPSPPIATNPLAASTEALGGTLRRIGEKDLLLQIASGTVLRFRLLAKTEFRSQDGKPVRDSLLRPGDRLSVNVNPDDVETALSVILVKSGSPSEREAAAVPVAEGRIVTPDQSNFASLPSPEKSEPPASAPPPQSANPLGQGPRESMLNPTDGKRYVWIPPGAFTMGCSPGDGECGDNENAPHAERIANGFWLAQTEVTQAAFRQVTGRNPSFHKGDQLPVESVTWNDAVTYCAAVGGRLPTEAEWEYAARAGTTASRYGDLDAVAWHSGNSRGTTRLVAQKKPNEFGLYDMLGNVWEWVNDSYAGSSNKILKGGSPFVDPRNVRASSRLVVEPSASANGRGFRCAVDYAAAAQKVYRHADGVSTTTPTYRPDPQYSEEARKAKWQGSVLLSLVVDEGGMPADVIVTRELGLGLDEKAIEAVQRWRFTPGLKDGKLVKVEAQVEVVFRLLQ